MQEINKKSEYELRREQKLKAQEHRHTRRSLKRTLKYIAIILIAGGVIAGLSWYFTKQATIPAIDVVSRSGIHWHPELSIFVKGVKQEIPANIGIGITHQPIHTHDADGILHLEFIGLVTKQDIMLGQFFKNWGKDMRSFGTNMNMTVNGEENTEFENYEMHDDDKIEIRYE